MAKRKKLKSFKFDIGNSSDGPLGMVIRVWAYTKKEAIEVANKYLASRNEIDDSPDGPTNVVAGTVEYATIYLAPNLTKRDIYDPETEIVEETQA